MHWTLQCHAVHMDEDGAKMGRSYKDQKNLDSCVLPASIFGLWLIMVLGFYGGEGVTGASGAPSCPRDIARPELPHRLYSL